MSLDAIINQLRIFLLPYLNSLLNFEFYLSNPLFWLFLLILALVLKGIWPERKSLYFCLAVGVVLLAVTKVEVFLADTFIEAQAAFDPTLIRVLAAILIAAIFLFYATMKD